MKIKISFSRPPCQQKIFGLMGLIPVPVKTNHAICTCFQDKQTLGYFIFLTKERKKIPFSFSSVSQAIQAGKTKRISKLDFIFPAYILLPLKLVSDFSVVGHSVLEFPRLGPKVVWNPDFPFFVSQGSHWKQKKITGWSVNKTDEQGVPIWIGKLD